MRLNNSAPYAQKLFRARAALAPLACALLAALLAASGSHAQQQPANSNAAGQQPAKRAKRITPLRSSDSAQGSRVTITSDGELNDYSAYRSGDRFIVVIPQAQGGGGEGAHGRGFEGAQVSHRGNDLVYTFKLQPGASAKVSQRFNRLDVQFTAPKGSEPPAGTQTAPTPRTPAEIAGIKPQPAASPSPARANPSLAPNQPQVFPSPSVAANPSNVSPSLPSIGTTPATTPSVAPSVAPPVAPAATPVQLAQAQATPALPVNVSAPSTVATTSTLGAFVQRNLLWFIGALLVVGVGLLLVTRLGDRRTTPMPPTTSPQLRAATTTAASTIPAKPAEVAPATPTAEIAGAQSVVPPAAATAPVAARSQKGSKEKRGKKGKKDHAVAEPFAGVEAAKPAPVEAEKIPANKPVKPTQAAGVADPASRASDLLAPAAPVAEGARVEPKSEEVKGIELAAAPAADTERVGEEIRKLFAGEAYDESVVGAGDRATREMVSSELLAGLTSRNAERNTRARAAFLKHGYFEDATRDLQSAEAPAQRASAAHALSLLRERTTTPHLIAALEDPSSDVRRASVEALAELRDPAALGPLEALRWRETSRQVPRALILRAVEACTPSVEETEAAVEPGVGAGAPEAAAPGGALISEVVAEPEVATPGAATPGAAVTEAAPTEAASPEAEPPATEATGVTGSGGATLSDVTVETAAAATPLFKEEEVSEMIAGVGIPREGGGAPVSADEAAVEFEATPALKAAPAESSSGTTRQQFAAQEDVTAEHAAGGAQGFAEREVETIAAAEATAAVESPAFVEPRVEEVESAKGVVAAAPTEGSGEGAPTEAMTGTDAAGELAATGAIGETVYTYDDGAASDWTALGGESPTPGARRGTGGLDERAPAQLESFDRAADETGETAGQQSPVYAAPEFAVASGERVADDWLDLDVDEQPAATGAVPAQTFEPAAEANVESTAATSSRRSAEPSEHAATTLSAPQVTPATASEPARSFVPDEGEDGGAGAAVAQKGIDLPGIEPEDVSIIPKAIQLRLGSEDASERAASVRALASLDTGEAFQQICAAFDDPAQEVREAAARALHDSSEDRAESFTRALRESQPERRRNIGASLASSGLAEEAVSQLTGESREKTYDAFSLLFLMAKAGETAPLIRAVESHPENEVRLAVVKLLALSGQQEVLPSFKRLAVRGSLPNEVRSAVMEAIYQISSSGAGAPPQPTKPTRTV
jgi:HEAT repeat protein